MLIKKLSLILLFIGILSGCGAQKFVIAKHPAQPFSNYDGIEAREFSTRINVPSEIRDEFNKFLSWAPKAIEEEIADYDLFSSNGSNKVVIEGNITVFDPGSRFARWLGFGGGEGIIRAQVEIKDSSGRIIASGEAIGSVTSGGFGGSFDDAKERFVSAIVEFIYENY